jgi:hypothetical protein
VTENALRPKRKRRRWIIAGVLPLLVIIVGWWRWPRENARFVGRWELVLAGQSTPTAILVFNADGGGTSRHWTGTVNVPLTWSTAGGWLFVDDPTDDLAVHAVQGVTRLLVAIAQTDLGGRVECLKITGEGDADTIPVLAGSTPAELRRAAH